MIRLGSLKRRRRCGERGPSRSSEPALRDQYIMPGIARLLDCLAYEMRHNGTLGHDVVSAATEVSGHIIAFLAGDERIR